MFTKSMTCSREHGDACNLLIAYVSPDPFIVEYHFTHEGTTVSGFEFVKIQFQSIVVH